MTEEKKPRSKSTPPPEQVAKLLQDAADILNGISGKDADIWQAIAVRVDFGRASVEKYK